jgi:amino acid transporter
MPALYFPAAVSVGVFVAYLMTGLCHGRIREYEKDLDPEQKETYKRISAYRLWCFVVGVLLALLALFVYLLVIRKKEAYHAVWDGILILLLVPMIVYLVIPKPRYMLPEGSTEKETKNWFSVYTCMSRAMMNGFLLGFFLSLLILWLIDRSTG